VTTLLPLNRFASENDWLFCAPNGPSVTSIEFVGDSMAKMCIRDIMYVAYRLNLYKDLHMNKAVTTIAD
jgi:hypothetical protein